MKYLILLFLICFNLSASQKVMPDGFLGIEQSGVGNISTFEATALFQMDSTTQGLLMSRMSTTNRDAISSPATGLMIYNTTTNKVNVYDSAAWVVVGGDETLTTEGDILYYSTENARLGIGSEGQVLTTTSGVPAWEDAASGADAETVIGLNDFTTNSGFESGDTTGWTNSGATYSVQAVTVVDGSYSASWDAAADGDTLTSDAFTLPTKLKLNNVTYCFQYQGGDTNIRFIINDGTNDFAEGTLYASVKTNHYCLPPQVTPDVSTITMRLEADADAAIIYADNFQMALASTVNISQISQAELYGGVVVASDAAHSVSTSSTSWTVSSDVSVIATDKEHLANAIITDTAGDYGLKFTTLPMAKYRVVVTAPMYCNSTGTEYCNWGITDGTTVKGVQEVIASVNAQQNSIASFETVYEYDTPQENIEFLLQSKTKNGVGSARMYQSNGGEVSIYVYRYPLSSQTAYSASTQMVASGVTIAADNTHSFTTTSASYVKATDTDIITTDKTHFGTAIETSTAGDFGFKMPYLKANTRYKVYAKILLQSDGTSTSRFAIYDGTNYIAESELRVAGNYTYLSGTIEYSSVQNDLEFTLYAVKDSGSGSVYVRAYNTTAEIGIIPIGEGVNMPQILEMYEIVILSDVKTLGTNAGDCSTSSWVARTLNTTQNPKSWLSLSSNQITLSAGKYKFKSKAPLYMVDRSKSRLYNITDAAIELNGTAGFSDNNTGGQNMSHTFVDGIFTITGTKVFELQQRCQVTFGGGHDLGLASSITHEEVYTVVEIQKIGN